MRANYVARARALVGTPFRAQGRGTDGLDCIGVIVASFGIDPDLVRRDYPLRGGDQHELEAALKQFFRRVADSDARPGDVLLLAAARDQMHLAVKTGRGFVHAHAGLRRVVETPGVPSWPLLRTFRRRAARRN